MPDVVMPQMGESIAEGTVTQWLKKVGDKVQRDEPLFEISTDKVDAEIPSPAEGVLTEIRVQPGQTVPINSVVAVIAESGEARAPAGGNGQAAGEIETRDLVKPPPPEPIEKATADTTAKTAQTKAPLSTEDEGPPYAEPVTTRPPPPPSPASPSRHAAQRAPAPAPARPVAPSRPVAPPRPPPVREVANDQGPASLEERRRTKSSPLVRKIAAEHGVDVSEVPGTGIGGRVTKEDILSFLEQGEHPAEQAARPPPEQRPAAEQRAQQAAIGIPSAGFDLRGPVPDAYRPRVLEGDRVEEMSTMRSKIAEHMVLSRRISAHVQTVWEADATQIVTLRNLYKDQWADQHGVTLTYTSFIMKAAVDALKAFPVVNSSIDGNQVIYHENVNLGLAVALEWGLIVPVVQRADELNLLGLQRRANDLAERARTKKLKPDEVQNGTFTITNPGVFGSLFGLPIINQPQVAIMGVGAIEKRPVVIDDMIGIRSRMYFSLSFDHRIVDGATADQFMAQVKRNIEGFDEGQM